MSGRENDDANRKEAFEQVFGALFATTVEGAKLLAGSTPAGAAITGFGVVAYGLGALIGRGMHRTFYRRRDQFTTGYVRALGNDPEAAKEHVDEAVNDDDKSETMYHAFRQMMDAVDGCVADALGMLAGTYTYQGKKVDPFFRGLGRVLCDLDAEEFEAFKEMMRAIGGLEKTTYIDEVVISCKPPSNPPYTSQCLAYLPNPQDAENWKTVTVMHPAQALRLVHLLRMNRLGTEPDLPATFGSSRTDHRYQLNTKVVADIVRIIDPRL